jgi:hypothetical protein
MPELISAKLTNTCTEKEHHAMALELSQNKLSYDYSFGLIMGKTLIFSALEKNLVELTKSITDIETLVKAVK